LVSTGVTARQQLRVCLTVVGEYLSYSTSAVESVSDGSW